MATVPFLPNHSGWALAVGGISEIVYRAGPRWHALEGQDVSHLRDDQPINRVGTRRLAYCVVSRSRLVQKNRSSPPSVARTQSVKCWDYQVSAPLRIECHPDVCTNRTRSSVRRSEVGSGLKIPDQLNPYVHSYCTANKQSASTSPIEWWDLDCPTWFGESRLDIVSVVRPQSINFCGLQSI